MTDMIPERHFFAKNIWLPWKEKGLVQELESDDKAALKMAFITGKIQVVTIISQLWQTNKILRASVIPRYCTSHYYSSTSLTIVTESIKSSTNEYTTLRDGHYVVFI